MALIPWQEAAVAKEIASGAPYKEIMSDWDISERTVQRIKNRQRELIASEGEKYLAALPDAIQMQVRLIGEVNADLGADNDVVRDKGGAVVLDSEGKEIPIRLSKRDPVLFRAGVSASENALKASGILPSQNLSMNIQNVYNDNKQQILSPAIAGMIGGMFKPADADADQATGAGRERDG